MGKSVYSLLLNDEVVDLIDKMAIMNGTSRSNMVEKILADTDIDTLSPMQALLLLNDLKQKVKAEN